jgi:uncharacterized protein (DUF952 family)
MVRLPMQLLYKIMTADEWALTERSGVFEGSAVDHHDGFIHLSAHHQVRETAARHFAGQDGLVLVAFGADFLAGLKWEPSRGGDLFPHVYGAIPAAAARWAKPLPLVSGAHRFPDEVPS